MENEQKVILICATITVVMLALVVTDYHKAFDFQFPGFETLFGIVGTVFLAVIFKGLGRINQKEGLWDD